MVETKRLITCKQTKGSRMQWLNSAFHEVLTLENVRLLPQNQQARKASVLKVSAFSHPVGNHKEKVFFLLLLALSEEKHLQQ